MEHLKPSQHEHEQASKEAFIAPQAAEQLVHNLLLDSGRVDSGGVIQPIEVTRREHDPMHPNAVGRRVASTSLDDILIPTKEQQKPFITADDQTGQQYRNTIAWDTQNELYEVSLTGRRIIDLSSEQITDIERDETRLVRAVENRGDLSIQFETGRQIKDAIHIKKEQGVDADFSTVRVYIPGGLQGPQITAQLLEKGADFSYAKLWSPQLGTGEQAFRDDVPIISAETYDQLASIVQALREMHGAGELSPVVDAQTSIGQPISGLPGVFIGQAQKGSSFNGDMSSLFAEPIERACQEVATDGSGKISDEWFRKVGELVAADAASQAVKFGRDPRHHAFLAGQPIDKILAAIAA